MDSQLDDDYQRMVAETIMHNDTMHKEERRMALYDANAPSVLYRPKLSIDGNQWCALYGDNLQDGVAGFGTSPEKAMKDFNKHWLVELDQPRTEER